VARSEPVAVIVYGPAGPLTVNVQPPKAPAPFAVHELTEPSDPPPVIENVIVTPPSNPVPEAVTSTPVGPWVGESVNAGVVIVNGAEALATTLVALSPLTVTSYVPSVKAGT
jgi:hypothetical protein